MNYAVAYYYLKLHIYYLLMLPVHVFSLLKLEDSERFKTIVQFECRGLEPVDFQPQVRYYIQSSSF